MVLTPGVWGPGHGHIPTPPLSSEFRDPAHLLPRGLALKTNPCWKTIPTQTFETISQSFGQSALGCVPLGFQLSQKDLVIAYTPSTPTLFFNLAIVRAAFLDYSINIMFEKPWSPIHLPAETLTPQFSPEPRFLSPSSPISPSPSYSSPLDPFGSAKPIQSLVSD
ncbi:hypothetical protein RSAG8_07201, partial [Rhizoctonia solani AG-8 WAC10335]